MGTVYLAQDLHLQRPVAIKVLPPELAVREELRERFLRETRVAAGFSHPNIVPVHGVEEHPQLLAFVMGYIEGETLGARVRRTGPLSAADAVRMLQEMAWALSYAHGRGVVHRDIKPDNILIERATGRSLLTDFGIARSSVGAASNLTQVGEVVGTPPFMSPEQAAGETLDGRSDLYSLGVVAFFAVTGRLPFEAESASAVMAMHLTQPPPRVGALRPDLPQSLASVIDRCLEKRPADRFETGEALAAALDPMRASRREVAPAVRLFQLQATEAFRFGVIVLGIELIFQYNPIGDGNVDHALPVIIGAAVLWGILAQLFGRARALLAGGFSFEEVAGGMRAAIDERVEARALERADPGNRRRERRRRWIMLASLAYGVFMFAFVFRKMRVRTGPDTFGIGVTAQVLLLSAAIMLGIGLALIMMNSARTTALATFIARLWGGPLGRMLFRLAGWRLAGKSSVVASRSMSTLSGPLSLIAGLPVAPRRALSGARSQIETLEATLTELAGRQRAIDAALADAGAATPSSDTAFQARRAELVGDLNRAREETVTKRDRLAAALENVRLQLLRVKSGIGTPEDVTAELLTAQSAVA